MNSIKNALLQITIGLVLFGIVFSVVMADVTYTYTGKTNSITSNKIVGSFTLPISLIPNKIYEYTPVSIFSFSDGKTRFTDRNTTKSRAGFANGFWLKTDSKGDIKSWTIQLFIFDPEPPKVNSSVKALHTIHDPLLGVGVEIWDQSYYGICTEVRDNNCNGVSIINDVFLNLDRAGTWKISIDKTNSSPQTGLTVSKALNLAMYLNGFRGRLELYLPFATSLVSVCPVTGTVSCYALGAVAIATAGIEGYQIGKIIKDPPDPLYFEIFQPRQYPAFTLDSSSGLPQGLIDTANAAFRDQTEMASLLEAWRVTLERYSAAQTANDQSNMMRQSAALDDYIIQTSRLATLAQQSFDEFLDQLEAVTGPVLISPDQMQDEMNNLAVNGFSQSVLDRLSSFGLGSAEIEELRSTLLQAPPLSDTVDFYSIMRSTEGSYGELSAITRYVVGNNLLTVTKAGNGNGTITSTPTGIDCGTTCTASFGGGTSVTLTATPAAGSTFAGWSPASCGSPFTLTADTTCTATFNLANRSPIANAGSDQTVESAGPNGASVTLDGSASSDPDNDPLTFAWTGPFGTATESNPTITLPLGIHTLTLTVDDGHGGTATDTVVVRVRDTTPPLLKLPADITTEATSVSGAIVTYTVSATDNVDGALTPNCTPASGSAFPVGATSVNCTATDQAGNKASGSFKVTVNSTTPPPGTSAFSAFSVNSLRINQRLKTLFLLSNFTLGQNSNGIDPAKEAVTLTIAGFTATIPAGSFRKGSGPFGVYAYAGKIDGVPIEMLITPLSNKRFGFQAAAYGVSPSVANNSVTVGLAIGNDSGTTTVNNAIIR